MPPCQVGHQRPTAVAGWEGRAPSTDSMRAGTQFVPLPRPPKKYTHTRTHICAADEDFDEFLGIGTGAAALFGTTGGVMEAALRWAHVLQ